MNTQKATIQPAYKAGEIGAWRDKAEHYKSLVVMTEDGMCAAIKSVIKYPNNGVGRVRVAVWIFGKPETMHGTSPRHGTGTASGYGYHKASAAFSDAAKNAGINLDDDINGRGDGAVNDAMLAIASAIYGQTFELRKNALIIG